MQQVERHKHVFKCRQRRAFADIVPPNRFSAAPRTCSAIQFINSICAESHRCATLLEDPDGRAS